MVVAQLDLLLPAALARFGGLILSQVGQPAKGTSRGGIERFETAKVFSPLKKDDYGDVRSCFPQVPFAGPPPFTTYTYALHIIVSYLGSTYLRNACCAQGGGSSAGSNSAL